MPASSSTTRRWGPCSAVMRPPSWRRARPSGGAPARGRRRGSEIVTVVPRPGVGVDVDRAAVLLDDPVDDREAEPGAAGKAVGERREEAVPLLGRHPVALVGERHVPVTALERGRDRERAAAGHRGEGVARDVPEDLPELPGVGRQRRPSGGSRSCTTIGGGARPRRCARGASGRRRAPRARRPARRRAPSGGRTGGSPRGSSERRCDSATTISISRCSGDPGEDEFLQDLDRAGDRGERVADLVRDSGRELADGGELVLEPHLALEPLELA